MSDGGRAGRADNLTHRGGDCNSYRSYLHRQDRRHEFYISIADSGIAYFDVACSTFELSCHPTHLIANLTFTSISFRWEQ